MLRILDTPALATGLFLAQSTAIAQDLFASLLQGSIAVGVIYWFMRHANKDSKDIKEGIQQILGAIGKQASDNLAASARQTLAIERSTRVKLLELVQSEKPIIARQAQNMLSELDTEAENPTGKQHHVMV